MWPRLLLLLHVSLVTNNKINYFGLVLAETLTLLVGVGLWVIGVDLWRGASKARKIGGALVLVVATFYSLGWLGANYWEYLQLREYF